MGDFRAGAKATEGAPRSRRLTISGMALVTIGVSSVALWARSTPTELSPVTEAGYQAPAIAAGSAPATSDAPSAPSRERVFVSQYCVRCHNGRMRVGGLVLDDRKVDGIGNNASLWEQVAKKVESSAMPPPGAARPDVAARHAFVAYLHDALDSAAALRPNPGRTVVHRLNRAEYESAIRDLLGLEVDASALLPADDEDDGFDNIADILSVSPTLLERYLSAARHVSELAIGDPSIRSGTTTYAVEERAEQDDRASEDLPFDSRGGVAIRHYFPLNSEYVIRVRLRRTLYNYIRGLGHPQVLDVRVDGQPTAQFTVGGGYQGPRPPASYSGDIIGDPEWEDYSHRADDGLTVRFPMKAGMRTIGVSFRKAIALPEHVLDVPPDMSTFGYAVDEMPLGNAAVAAVLVDGPSGMTGAGDTPSRRRIFSCRPSADESAQQQCARKILSALARRAFRRPITQRDTTELMTFYASGASQEPARRFEAGVQFGLERLLTDPEFLFRVERDPAQAPANTPYRISDLALASRLSFFLWGSIPDDHLLDVADSGKLRKPEVLAQEVRRMLVDSRAHSLITNFADQWLRLRDLRSVAPDPALFPNFNESLRRDMLQETELFLDSQRREDRSVVDLVRADYTFLNERLAEHYGVPGIYGMHFRRVSTESLKLGGLLGQASLMTITSYPTRTSPVLRGKWVLETIFGTPPPPPPPNVPSLPETVAGKAASVRERLEMHRQSPACASCHSRMDPLGFALENFDSVGRWRAVYRETGKPVDAVGTLADGVTFDGPSGLQQIVLDQSPAFIHTFAEKLLEYALGRRIEYYDQPAVRGILRRSAPGGFTWSAIVTAIVESVPFQMRMTAPTDSATASTARSVPGDKHP